MFKYRGVLIYLPTVLPPMSSCLPDSSFSQLLSAPAYITATPPNILRAGTNETTGTIPARSGSSARVSIVAGSKAVACDGASGVIG